MKKTFRAIIYGSVCLMPAGTQAASIAMTGPDTYGRYYINIRGEIVQGDDKLFESQIGDNPDPNKIIVTLASPGGIFNSGINIAYSIRKKHLATLVPDGELCGSICAVIWVSGSPRYVERKSKIAFHNVYDPKTLTPSAEGNAVLGAYLGSLGFDYPVIRWMSEAPANGANYLTPAIANELGITVTLFPKPTQPEPTQPVYRPNPMPSWPTPEPPPRMVNLRVTQDVHLRVAPNPYAGYVLGPPPNDYVPADTIVTNSTNWCTTNDNIKWCYINYQEARGWVGGWVNARYLESADAGTRDSPKPKPAPAPVPSEIKLRVVQDLHLRYAPDASSGDVLGPPPNDFIPTGTIVTLYTNRCTQLSGSETKTWCYINYQEARGWMGGWVNTHYLEYTSTGARYS